MDSEIKLLEGYANAGATLPQEEFFDVFKQIIRLGNDEEVKKALNILSTLEGHESLNNFVDKCFEVSVSIRRSKHSYYIMEEAIQNFKNSPVDLGIITVRYSKIKDDILLGMANEKLKGFLQLHPNLSSSISIRKTEKELEQEKEKAKEPTNEERSCGLAILDNYIKMGSALPQKEFVRHVQRIIRFGSEEEEKAAHTALTILAENNDLKDFALRGLAFYETAINSKVGFLELLNAISNYTVGSNSLSLIVNSYQTIKDDVFLEAANKELKEFFKSHPDLAYAVPLRKTKKELEQEKNDEKDQKKQEVEQFRNLFNEFTNNFRNYLLAGKFTTEKNGNFQTQLQYLQLQANKCKSGLGNDYQSKMSVIRNATIQLNQIEDAMKLDQQTWQY